MSPDGPISQNVSIGPAFGWNQENSLDKHYHCTHFSAPLLLFCPHLDIPHICHGRHEYIRVNFFWPVEIFTDLTRKIGIFDKFYAKKWHCFYRYNAKLFSKNFARVKKMTNIRYEDD